MLSLAVHIHLARFEKLSEPLFINFEDAAEQQMLLLCENDFQNENFASIFSTTR